MREKTDLLHTGAIVLVGMAMAIAVYLGLAQIGRAVDAIHIPSSSTTLNASPAAFALPGPDKRFVVVKDWGGIETYVIDTNGHIQVTDDYDSRSKSGHAPVAVPETHVPPVYPPGMGN